MSNHNASFLSLSVNCIIKHLIKSSANQNFCLNQDQDWKHNSSQFTSAQPKNISIFLCDTAARTWPKTDATMGLSFLRSVSTPRGSVSGSVGEFRLRALVLGGRLKLPPPEEVLHLLSLSIFFLKDPYIYSMEQKSILWSNLSSKYEMWRPGLVVTWAIHQ